MYLKKFSHSLVFRFATIFVFLGLLPLGIILGWALLNSNKSLSSYLEEQVFELIKQKAEYTSLQLNTVEDVVHNISNVEDVISSLQEESDTLSVYQKLKIQANIGYVLAGNVNLEGIESIDIHSRNSNRYHYGSSLLSSELSVDDKFMQILAENTSDNSSIYWHGSKESFDKPGKYSLIASKKLSYFDPDTMSEVYLGLLVIHYSLDTLAQNFSDKFSQKFSSYVIDNKNKILVSPNSQQIGLDFKEVNNISKHRLHNFDKIDYEGDRSLLLKYNLEEYGLKVFTFISNKHLRATQFNSLRVSLFGILFIFIFTMLIFYIFTKRILIPVKELTEAFMAISKNRYDLDSSIKIKSIDEIGELQMWFNSFVKNIKEKNKYSQELMEQKQLAEKANRTKDSFLANISHELRTPLNGVISVSELLADTELNPKQKDYVDVILQSSEILYSLINHVLDFSKISAHKLLLTSTNFNIIALFDRLSNLYKLQAKIKNLSFDYKPLPYKTLYVFGDETSFQKILMNLLGNSLKFTISGGIVFSIEELKRDDVNVTLKISVADTGLGVPDEKKQVIFEAFEQVDDSLAKRISGSGLGLSIAQQLSYLMKSQIKLISPNPNIAEDAEYPGSLFYFEVTLPLSENVSQINADIQGPDEYMTNEGICLVVEDNLINQKVISSILAKEKLVVDIAGDWRETLNLINEKQYDYIFMDIQMPEVTGLELTKILREKGIVAPIIAVTGNVIDEVKAEALKVGMDDFIVKPLKRSEIIRVLKKYQGM